MTMFKVAPEVKARRQEKSTNCWLSCFEMLFQWKYDRGDRTKNPSQICDLIDRSPNLWSDYMTTNGIASYECREAGRMLGMICAGDGEIYGEHLQQVLKTYGPIWIAGRWYQNYDHVLVITGCDTASGKIKYINPWKNYTLEESNGTISWLNARGNEWRNCDASVMYWR